MAVPVVTSNTRSIVLYLAAEHQPPTKFAGLPDERRGPYPRIALRLVHGPTEHACGSR